MREICQLSDLSPASPQIFSISDEEDIIVIKVGEQVFAYLNQCPHAFAKLNLYQERIIGLDGYHLMCTVHGALFDPKSGHCVAGPCAGQRITPLKIDIHNGMVCLLDN